jgi:hypothetical protein
MKKLLVLLSLAALLFAGCGGGDDDGGSVDTASDEASGADDTDFEGDEDSDFCDLAKKYEEEFDDSGDSSDTEDFEADFKELSAAIDKLADEAPGEIEGDVETIADAFNQYNDLLKKYDYDFSKIPEEESKKISLDNPEVEQASNRVESYFEKVCKMDSDGDGDTDGVIDDDSAPDAGSSGDEQAPDDETDATTGE